jgi:hypothetical protein
MGQMVGIGAVAIMHELEKEIHNIDWTYLNYLFQHRMSKGAYLEVANMDVIYGYTGFLQAFLKIEKRLREVIDFNKHH